MNAGVAGESAAPGGGNWFTIESRANNVTGDPYLVNFGPDINSLTAPAANRLTFAVATYDGTTESLYWAYGVNGAHSASSVGASLNTVATNFVIGENYSDSAWTGVQIGKVLVYDNALTSTQANALITSLQQYYSPTPEPSSLVLLLIGGAGAMLVYRRRRSA